MTTQAIDTNPRPRLLGRSTAAVLVGFFACALLSLGTDQILHLLKVYPPWGEPMWDPGFELSGVGLSLCLRSRCGLHHRQARASQSNAPRLGFGFHRARHGCGWHRRYERHGLRSTLVSGRACRHFLALCLARRSPTSQVCESLKAEG